MAVRTQVDEVASIVEQRDGPSFVNRLRSANSNFASKVFEAELAAHLRTRPHLVEAWTLWCGDQRWSPSAYVDGTETGWYDANARRGHVRRHQDEAAAVADLIHRMAAWLADKRIVTPEDLGSD